MLLTRRLWIPKGLKTPTMRLGRTWGTGPVFRKRELVETVKTNYLSWLRSTLRHLKSGTRAVNASLGAIGLGIVGLLGANPVTAVPGALLLLAGTGVGHVYAGSWVSATASLGVRFAGLGLMAANPPCFMCDAEQNRHASGELFALGFLMTLGSYIYDIVGPAFTLRRLGRRTKRPWP